ncbi:pyridoxal phosphate-dependent transferase [Crepidotus variabilis]|uniref:Pyridoxal phosphate-dependent transferase n=1 Tax=Crepidotus variabilis TaxID=179855 RepID=A0A9P6JVF9_9AGAR|nr:pyridoxal phosphate-dependent transferase [Crepidotus variabilis]
MENSLSTTAAELRVLSDEYYEKFLSVIAKSRKPNPIRGLYPLEKKPGVISLLAGKPNASSFPFTSFSFTVTSPTSSSLSTSPETKLTIDGAELAEALQYSDTAGLKQLLEWTTGLQTFSHQRELGEGWRISVGSGSQDLLYKAVASIFNPGDPILVEAPAYSGAIAIFEALKCLQIEIQTDDQGILPSSLRSILDNWPEGKAKPKGLYTIPYGGNPSGTTIPVERRLQVLQLALEHDFLILEDDPYYYLYYSTSPRPQSYFSLEREITTVGRVLRFDSFSKILSAGIRIGFATGPTPLLNAIDGYTATSNLQTSSFTQAVVVKLLTHWGYEGFHAHTEKVSAFYKEKRDVFETAMKKHLGGLAEWTTPVSGLFFWFKLILPGEDDSEAIIKTKAYENGVLALPGTVFLPSGSKTTYARAAFSLLSEEDIDEALRRLRGVLITEQQTSESSVLSLAGTAGRQATSGDV